MLQWHWLDILLLVLLRLFLLFMGFPLCTVFCGLNWTFQSSQNDLILCSQKLGFCLLVVNDAPLFFFLLLSVSGDV